VVLCPERPCGLLLRPSPSRIPAPGRPATGRNFLPGQQTHGPSERLAGNGARTLLETSANPVNCGDAEVREAHLHLRQPKTAGTPARLLRSQRESGTAEIIQGETGGARLEGKSAGQSVGVSRPVRARAEPRRLSRRGVVQPGYSSRRGRNHRVAYRRREAGRATGVAGLLPQHTQL
jgi:hypothetical protein